MRWAGALLLLGGLVIGAISSSNATFWVAATGLALGYLWLILTGSVIALYVFITALGLSSNIVTSVRIYLWGIPLSANDFLSLGLVPIGLVGIRRWKLEGESRRTFSGMLVLGMLGYFSTVCVARGFDAGLSAYAVLQEARFLLYFAAGALAAQALLRPHHAKGIVIAMLGAGLVSSVWQVTLLLGGYSAMEEVIGSNWRFQPLLDDPLRTLRDTSLGWAPGGAGVVALLWAGLRGCYVKSELLTIALIGVLLTGLVTSGTRTYVLPVLLVSSLAVVLRVGRTGLSLLSRWRFLVKAALATILLLLGSSLLFPGIFESVIRVAAATFTSEDSSYVSRMEASQEAIREIAGSPSMLLFGLGLGNSGSGALMANVKNYDAASHNGYVWLFLSGGLIGFLWYMAVTIDSAAGYFSVWRHLRDSWGIWAVGVGLGGLSLHLAALSIMGIRGWGAGLFGILIGFGAVLKEGRPSPVSRTKPLPMTRIRTRR